MFCQIPLVKKEEFLNHLAIESVTLLILSSICTLFNTLTEKGFRKTLWKKVKLLKMSNFTFFNNIFMQSVPKNPLLATFQLLSATSLSWDGLKMVY